MNKNTKILFLVSVIFVILVIIPYTREVDIYTAKDVQWKMFHNNKRYKTFDKQHFHFRTETEISDELRELNQTEISIKGFFHEEMLGKEQVILLTENRLEVCAFCNHEELGYSIILKFRSDSLFLSEGVQTDSYIEVKGTFFIDDKNEHHSPFVIKNIQSVKKLGLKK